MPISRYIVAAVVRYSSASPVVTGSAAQRAQAEMAVGDKGAHAEPGAKLECTSESILRCVCGVGGAAKQPPSPCFVATLSERNCGPQRALGAGPRLRQVTRERVYLTQKAHDDWVARLTRLLIHFRGRDT